VLDGAIWIRAIRNIQPGVELAYDYALVLEKGASKQRSLYTCRCGAAKCRGTMLYVRGGRGH
jgi:SET domain-containing protein